MRTILPVGLLLVLLAVGVVQAQREGEGGGLLAGWVQPEEGEGAAASPDPAAPRAVAPRAAPEPDAAPSVLAAGELSVLEPEAPEPMVRYVDAEGSVHMVRGLERVPAPYRERAVVLGRGNVNVVSVPAPTAVAFRDWKAAPNPNRQDVVLFSAEWCGACRSAKRHLDRRGVRYHERDIDDDEAAKREVEQVLGRIAIPLLDVEGRYISGYRPDVYDRALVGG